MATINGTILKNLCVLCGSKNSAPSAPLRFKKMTTKLDWLILIPLTALAAALRVIQIDTIPPGLRVDELSNALVVSQHILDGNPRIFYPDASGHEGLWHLIQAAFLAFGRTSLLIRAVSILFGTASIPLLYITGRTLFNRAIGLFASLALTVSFWSLMYSRTGTRHISTVPLLLATFACFWIGLRDETGRKRPFLLAGLFMGLTLHTYFAAWNAPLIILAFCAYTALFARDFMRGKWLNTLIMFGITALISLPLVWSIFNLPEVEGEVGRVSEVAKPLHEALSGNFSLIFQQIAGTFRMFHAEGDPEWLYNIAGRPLFTLPIALIFWFNLFFESYQNRRADSPHRHAIVFLMIWLLAGLAPSVVSVPAASLGHTIVAQPAVYLILALFLLAIKRIDPFRWLIALFLIGLLAISDLPAYFDEWPQRGNVRFLYHTPQFNLANHLQTTNQTDFGISSPLADQWDRVALEYASDTPITPRRFDPARALILSINGAPATNFTNYPTEGDGFLSSFYINDSIPRFGFEERLVDAQWLENTPPIICWENGLCLLTAAYNPPYLDITIEVTNDYIFNPLPLTSFPPIPGTYTGARLHVFAQLLTLDDQFIVGDDGLWVDPASLRPGDTFIQRHQLIPTGDDATNVILGLYNPMDGTRIPTTLGEDHYILNK